MPLKTPVPIDGDLVLAPAQRADLIVDVTANSGETAYLAYIEGNEAYVHPVRGAASTALRPAPRALPPNPQLEPEDLSSTVKARLVMEGGAMGRMRNADGESKTFRQLVEANQFWAFNGVVGLTEKPLIEVGEVRPCG